MFATIIRTILVYFNLIFAMRLTGKRQIGQMQMSEFVTALLLSELAALPITDLSIPLLSSLIPIILLLCLEISIPFMANKIPIFKKIIDGSPSIIIKKGVIDQDELDRLRLSIDELLSELRLKNITDIKDVEYAILEQNGQLSVITHAELSPATKKDVGVTQPEHGFAHPLIISGHYSQFNLSLTGKNKKWVKSKLKNKKLKDVLLFTVDDNEEINIITKERKQNK